MTVCECAVEGWIVCGCCSILKFLDCVDDITDLKWCVAVLINREIANTPASQ